MDLPQPTEGALAQPTRARIFAFLVEKRAPADTQELAAHFDLHPNGIRIHLERLEEDGFVSRSRSRGGTGRPRDLWAVSPEAEPGGVPPEAYAELATWLARSVPANQARMREVERTGHEVGAEIAPKEVTDTATGFRDLLAALGFEPQLESHPQGFGCTLRNCPYRNSARANQAIVCALHKGITTGTLAAIDPRATLTEFVPADPDQAGCSIEVELP